MPPSRLLFDVHSNYLLFLEMEDQISSAPNSGFCSSDGSTWPEESGWTMYFEDFGASCSGSSLISDATSCAAWKPSESDRRRKLRVKKRKQWNFVDDDDPLEDTATSPFDSFKDYELRDVSTSRRKKDDPRISSQEEDVGCRNEWESENENVFEFIERSNRCTDLNKRGLCLVPFSLVGCYLR